MVLASHLHKFHGGGFLIGRVFEILSNKERKCKFDDDGEIKFYTMAQMEAYLNFVLCQASIRMNMVAAVAVMNKRSVDDE